MSMENTKEILNNSNYYYLETPTIYQKLYQMAYSKSLIGSMELFPLLSSF